MYVCMCVFLWSCECVCVCLSLRLFHLFRLLASLKSTKARLYFHCCICGDLLLLPHKKSTEAGLNLGRTTILHRLSICRLLSLLLQPLLHRSLLLLLLASQCTRTGTRLAALGTVAAAAAAVEAIQLFAHSIATKSRLYLDGCTFLGLQR